MGGALAASCNKMHCASLAGLVLCFIACFILLVIAPLHAVGRLFKQQESLANANVKRATAVHV